MAPNRASAASASASMSDKEDTSVRSPSTGTPAEESSATVAASASSWMSPMTTFIPSAPQRSANALPMPLPAPVTMAVLPANSSTKRLLYLLESDRRSGRGKGDDADEGAGRLQPPQRVGRVVKRHPLGDQPLDGHPPGGEVRDGLGVGLVGESAGPDDVLPVGDDPEQRDGRLLRGERDLDDGAA